MVDIDGRMGPRDWRPWRPEHVPPSLPAKPQPLVRWPFKVAAYLIVLPWAVLVVAMLVVQAVHSL